MFGHELTRETVEGTDNAGETAMSGLRNLLRADGVDEAAIDRGLVRWVEPFTERYLDLLEDADTSEWRAAPDAFEALEHLELGHRVALLTGNPEAMARARLERLGLERFFPNGQGAFGSDGEHRTHLITLARRRAGNWPAARTVLVGDTPKDVEGGSEAGIRTVGVTTGRFDGDALREADAVVDNLAAVPPVVEDLAR